MLKDGEVVGSNRKGIEQFLQSLFDAGAKGMWCLIDSSKFDAAAQLWVERSRFGYLQEHEHLFSSWEVLWVHRDGAWRVFKASLGGAHVAHGSANGVVNGTPSALTSRFDAIPCGESNASSRSSIPRLCLSPRDRLLQRKYESSV